jgi:hypothetical protein
VNNETERLKEMLDEERFDGQDELLRGVTLLKAARDMTADPALRQRIDQARALLGHHDRLDGVEVERFDRAAVIGELTKAYPNLADLESRSDAYLAGMHAETLKLRVDAAAESNADASTMAARAAREAMIERNRGTAGTTPAGTTPRDAMIERQRSRAQ